MIDYKKSKYANLFIIGCFAFSLLVGIVLITISGSFLNNGVENPLFLLGCFCYIIIHEVIHLIFMKTFSKENIHISFKFPTISVGSNAKFSKRQFLIVVLAPVIILGILLALCIIFCPKKYTFFFYVLFILNFAGSGGDYLQAFVIRRYSAKTFFQDNSIETIVYQKN